MTAHTPREAVGRSPRAAIPTLGEIQARILPLLRGRGVRLALVFGSYARGTQDRHSDLDLILVVETEKRFFDRYDDFTAIQTSLPSLAIDLLIYTPEEWDSMSERAFIRQARSEGRVMYER